jgi:hypothetical protein
MIMTRILFTALLALHLALHLTVPEVPAAFQPTEQLTKEIDLSHWGMDSVEDIGFVSIGVLHGPDQDQMVVYDIRKEKPVFRIPDRPWGAVPEFSGNTFLVADFNEGNVNRLGGYFNGFSRALAGALDGRCHNQPPAGRRPGPDVCLHAGHIRFRRLLDPPLRFQISACATRIPGFHSLQFHHVLDPGRAWAGGLKAAGRRPHLGAEGGLPADR